MMPGIERYHAALGLAYLSNAHGNTLLRLLKDFLPEEVWEASPARLVEMRMAPAAAERFPGLRSDWATTIEPEAAARSLEAAGLRFLPWGTPGYPPQLMDLGLPPAGLFVKGDEARLRDLLASARITIVGTRRASAYGTRAARDFAGAFTSRGIAVISGMALGIDGRAHEAALERGGLTVAVLGCGTDVVYPRRHRALYEAIAAKGLVMSELPPGTPPSRWTFPNRNRLLAALGDGVLVVEGSTTSGAMQTGEQAAQLGRAVFAVPGSIYAEGHRGCNLLMRDGATPAIEPEATVEEFLLQTRIERQERQPPTREGRLGGTRQDPFTDMVAAGREGLLEAMEERPCSIDGLVLRTGMTARQLTVAIAELELAGLATRAGPGLYIRAP
jgi:DNA processing protein